MNDAKEQVFRLAAEGYCCSQIMVRVGLEAKQKENPELLDAVAGLCNGVHRGMCCGILTGAACLLSLFDKKRAAAFMIPALAEWFEATCAESYNGITCDDIIEQDPMNRMNRCPKLMEETILKCRELLADYGYTL